MPGGDPKETGRAGGDPKETGRAGGDPKETGRGGREGPCTGGGAGWVVVAFVSPVCMNVPEFASRMLGGGGPEPPRTGQGVALADAAVRALDKARKEARLRDEERNLVEKYKKLETTRRTPTK
jgi:hypothetical protein